MTGLPIPIMVFWAVIAPAFKHVMRWPVSCARTGSCGAVIAAAFSMHSIGLNYLSGSNSIKNEWLQVVQRSAVSVVLGSVVTLILRAIIGP